MTLDLDWDLPLSHRLGSAKRLAGIDVYCDFEWSAYFTDHRVQFRNGQCLAKQLRASCPEGKTPALLLTDRESVEEGIRSTARYHIFVVNLPAYRKASPDASLSYWAGRLGPGITLLSHLPELLAVASTDQVTQLILSYLTFEHVKAWMSDNFERIQQLRVLTQGTEPRQPAPVTDIIAAVDLLGGLDPDAVSALARLVGPGTNPAHRLEFLRLITEDPAGAHVKSCGNSLQEGGVDGQAAVPSLMVG